MGIGEIILVCFILLLAIFAGGTSTSSGKYTEKNEGDPDLKRMRQMKEWDRFDDSKK